METEPSLSDMQQRVVDLEALAVVPHPQAPDELRVVTKADLSEWGAQVRREMKLYLGLGIAGGNVCAAIVSTWIGKSPALPAQAAYHFLTSF
jgi:hypothetical protein